MKKSLKQLVDAYIKRVQDAAVHMRNKSLGVTKEQQEEEFDKVLVEANEELSISIAACIIEATEKKDPTILHHLFGLTAYHDYCSDAAINELMVASQQDRDLSETFLYKSTNSFFLRFGFYYACYKGVLPLIRYYIEQQPFVEDMGNVTVDARGIEKYFPNTPALKGPPLKLAVMSNNTECVEYLYENTEAMAEVECEDFSDKRSNLEIATINQNVALVRFLLSHAADPNAPFSNDSKDIMESLAKFGQSLFDLALETLNIEIITAYLEAGAIVSHRHIHAAVKARASLPILKLLFAYCINKEDHSKPYLLAAIETGDVEYLKLIESLSDVSSWQTISAYYEDTLHAHLVHIATSSGSFAMLQHIAAQHHIDVKAIATEDVARFETKVQSEKLNHTDPIKVSRIIRDTLIHKATSHPVLLQFYIETCGLILSKEALKFHCKASYGLRAISYFLSLLEDDVAKKEEFRMIAIDFETLPLAFLFRIFNTPLILNGNPLGDLYNNSAVDKSFISLMAKTILKMTNDMDVISIFQAINHDPAALKGALFYFCTELFVNDAKKFIEFYHLVLTKQAVSIDETNCLGTTLAYFAYQQQRDHAVIHFLTTHGANPDKPNNEGKTLLAQSAHYMGHGGEKWDQEAIAYIEKHIQDKQVGNSLLYKLNNKYSNPNDIILLLTASRGEIKPLSIEKLIHAIHISNEKNKREKYFTLLFTHLSDAHAIRLVQYLREPKTIKDAQVDAEEFKYYLQQIEKSEGLSSERKAFRLTVQPTKLAPPAMLFGSASSRVLDLPQTKALKQ